VSPTGPPAALAGLRAAPARAGIFTDFDGCLAEIVPDPDRARPVRGAATVLARLARRYRVVAVVSGRPVLDLARRLRAPEVRLVGLHGMEELRDREVVVLPEAAAARARVDHAAARLEEALRGIRGVALERKGAALAVHFRRAADPAEAERLAAPLVEAAARAEGLAVVPGRRILELRPPEGGDKGRAVRRIVRAEGLRAALVAGDDVGDLAAFEAVAELEVAVRVAVASPEAPAELLERADLVVEGPADLVSLLRGLAG
jgi:trehalose 6-phosphate phosphatase